MGPCLSKELPRRGLYCVLGVGSLIGQLILSLVVKRVFIRIQELYYGLFNHLEPPPPSSDNDEKSSTAILMGMLVVRFCLGLSSKQCVARLIVLTVDIMIVWLATVKRPLYIWRGGLMV